MKLHSVDPISIVLRLSMITGSRFPLYYYYISSHRCTDSVRHGSRWQYDCTALVGREDTINFCDDFAKSKVGQVMFTNTLFVG